MEVECEEKWGNKGGSNEIEERKDGIRRKVSKWKEEKSREENEEEVREGMNKKNEKE